VPGYKEKLEKSMDRFFEKLEVGKCVRRVNVSSLPFAYIWIEADGEKWTITTDDRLFVPSGNHLYDGEEAKEEEIDIDKVGFFILARPSLPLLCLHSGRHISAASANVYTDSLSPKL
jgi:hypothetical protein